MLVVVFVFLASELAGFALDLEGDQPISKVDGLDLVTEDLISRSGLVFVHPKFVWMF